jgi:glycosyltransferase involved in cell wall biosynthesis
LESAEYTQTLKKIYEKYNVSLVHFSTTWSTLYSLLQYKTWRLKRLITFYGPHYLEDKSARQKKSSLRQRLGDVLRKYLQYFGLITSHEIITFSQYSRQLLLRCFPKTGEKRIYIIPGYCDNVAKIPKNRRVEKRIHALSLVNIGRAEARKGIELLLSTAGQLRNMRIPFLLTIASPVSYYYALDVLRMYESLNLLTSVWFLHQATGTDRTTLLDQADLFIMPSLDLETFGLSALESLERGVPVIVTPTGALPEIISRVSPKLISKTSDPESITACILWYSKLPPRRKLLLRNKCVSTINRYYSETKWQKTIIQLYSSSLTKNRPLLPKKRQYI